VIELICEEGGPVCEEVVIISEVGWSGTAFDAMDEYIELRNLGTQPVSLAGWTLRWKAKNDPDDDWTVINLHGIIRGSPGGLDPCLCDGEQCDPFWEPVVGEHYRDAVHHAIGRCGVPPDDELASQVNQLPFQVWERIHQNTVSNVLESPLYHEEDELWSVEFSLPDQGGIVQLVNRSGGVVSTANAHPSEDAMWPAGSSEPNRTMERIDPLGPDEPWNWKTNYGVEFFGIDAAEDELYTTSDVPNEPVLYEIPYWYDGPISTVVYGERISLPLRITSEELDLSEIHVFTAVGEIVTEQSVPGVVEMHAETLVIDTARLVPGELNLIWVVYSHGVTDFIPLEIQAP
jgi:hypothetical protein